MAVVQRGAGAGAGIGHAELRAAGPGGEMRLGLPERMRGIENPARLFGAFQHVEFDETPHLMQPAVAAQPKLFEIGGVSSGTVKRFMARNICGLLFKSFGGKRREVRQDKGRARRGDLPDMQGTAIGAAQDVAGHDVAGRALGMTGAGGQQDHLVGADGGQIEVMHDGHHAAAGAGKVAGDAHDLKLMGDVEGGHRFIEKQPARHPVRHRLPDLGEHAGELHPLLFAARKLLVAPVGIGAEIDPAQRRPNAF